MSQYVNQRDIPGWEEKGCGMACICMVLWRAGEPYSYEGIVGEVTDMNGYVKGIGLKHTAIARVLSNHNIPAYQQEFTHPSDTVLRDIGIQKIEEQVAVGNLVIASVMRHFNPDASSTHLVLITAVRDGDFIIDDPDHDGGSAGISVPIADFSAVWRGYAIFAEVRRV